MMHLKDLPLWATATLDHYYEVDGANWADEWTEDNEGQFSRMLSVVYPDNAMHFYVVDRLRDDGWFQLEGTHWVMETALASARKRAYHDQVPHRIREVVWDG